MIRMLVTVIAGLRDLADRALLDSDGGNDQPGLRHPGTVQAVSSSLRKARRYLSWMS
jgi:hypothetical protein